jgi:hypothetical protein
MRIGEREGETLVCGGDLHRATLQVGAPLRDPSVSAIKRRDGARAAESGALKASVVEWIKVHDADLPPLMTIAELTAMLPPAMIEVRNGMSLKLALAGALAAADWRRAKRDVKRAPYCRVAEFDRLTRVAPAGPHVKRKSFPPQRSGRKFLQSELAIMAQQEAEREAERAAERATRAAAATARKRATRRAKRTADRATPHGRGQSAPRWS